MVNAIYINIAKQPNKSKPERKVCCLCRHNTVVILTRAQMSDSCSVTMSANSQTGAITQNHRIASQQSRVILLCDIRSVAALRWHLCTRIPKSTAAILKSKYEQVANKAVCPQQRVLYDIVRLMDSKLYLSQHLFYRCTTPAYRAYSFRKTKRNERVE